MTKQGKTKNCEACNKLFYEFPYLAGKRRFCSKLCSNKTTIEDIKKTKHSKSRKSVASNNKRWRYTWAYVEWRNKVFERDGYICQHCGKSKSLIAHHIKPYDKYPNLRIDIDNGITLCRSCHNKEDARIVSGQYSRH